MKDEDLIGQLEASFLSNVKRNFDPIEFNYGFNNCTLPKLKQNLENQDIKCADLFTFRCTFSPNNMGDEDSKNIITNLEQVGFTHSNRTSFARNLRRLIDKRNCLDFMFRNSTQFAQVK